jgi:hypothetical protein
LTPRSAPPSSLSLPGFLLGPRAGGRSYGLLKIPDAVARSAAASDRLGDLALSLHRWSRSGETGLVCFLPLDDAQGLWALIRAVNLGASDLGSVALARGVVLRSEDLEAIGWAPQRLLAGLEAPTYAQAGAPANAADVFNLAEATPQAATGDTPGVDQVAHTLAHTDRLIAAVSDAEAERLLCAILERRRPGQAPIEGWSAGGLLLRNGRFDPAATFRLAVVAQPIAAVAAAFPAHMPAELRDGALHCADIPDPKSWSAWRALFGAEASEYRIDAESDARLAALRWRPEFRDLRAEEVVRRQAVEASLGLDPGKPIAILHRLALAAGKLADPDLARDARRGLALAFGGIIAGDPAAAAAQIKGYLDYVQPYLDGALPAQPALLALDSGALSYLPAETVEVLTREGISRGLFERTLDFLDAGGRLGPDATVAMLGALVRSPPPRATPAFQELLVTLVEMTLPPKGPQLSGPARAAVLAAVEAGDLAGDARTADQLCEPLWTMLGAVPAHDPDYRRAVAIGRRLALSARAALRAPKDGPGPARLIHWAVRLVRHATPKAAA